MSFQTISVKVQTHKRLEKYKTLFGSKGKQHSFDKTINRLIDHFEATKYD